jgi:hypothetical protein
MPAKWYKIIGWWIILVVFIQGSQLPKGEMSSAYAQGELLADVLLIALACFLFWKGAKKKKEEQRNA